MLVAMETDVSMELVVGRAAIGFGWSVVSPEVLMKKPEGEAFGPVGAPVKLDTSGVGIAMRQGDTALREQVNGALRTTHANGTYDRLQKKYFDFDISGQ